MRNNEKEYIVYCHINNINNKKYIGITCQTPEQRFRNGKGYKSSKYFNSAIIKYGWENFTHTILFEHLSEKEAKTKEIELIAKYQTNKQNQTKTTNCLKSSENKESRQIIEMTKSGLSSVARALGKK